MIQIRKLSCIYHMSRAVIDFPECLISISCRFGWFHNVLAILQWFRVGVISLTVPENLKRVLKWGCALSADWMRWLWAGIGPTTEWWFGPPSEGNPSSGVGPPSGEIPAAELGSRLLPSRGVTHQWSCKLGKDLKWECDPLTDLMHQLRAGVGPIAE